MPLTQAADKSLHLTDLLNTIPSSRWTDQIGEGLGVFAREVDGKAIPSPDVIEWFAEWSRDSWGEQRGLKLLTAHRAKGLEFDDVVIMDGGWERPSRNEDQDAPRRLFYVAMTRARRNLIVMSNDHHEYLPTMSPAVVTRYVEPDIAAIPGPRRFFQSPEMRMVDLSFAGRQKDQHPVHRAISEATVGDAIQLKMAGGRWQIEDMSGRVLGRMAKAFAPPGGTKFVSGQIAAIIHWRKDDAGERFHHMLRREDWEVVVPDLVFEQSNL
jgi:ATP-dependent DNA helicase RecQ